MKKILLILICAGCMASCFGQEKNDPATRLSKEEYLKKSNKQKTVAGILFGVGSTAFVIAATGDISFDAAIPVIIVGGAAVLTSIPLFIASGKNKKRALHATAGIELQQIPNPSIIISKPVTALSIKFHF